MTDAPDPRFTENEIKLLVDDLAAAAVALEAAGAVLTAPRILERNVRYDDAAGTLTPASRVLRLRQDSRVRLTYKDEAGVALGDGSRSRYEAEVTVDDFDAMDAILRKLGYRPYFHYEKYRTTYTLHGAEVVLDEMPYGRFIEIEGDPEAIRAAVQAAGLEAAPPIRLGYARLFERLKARLGFSFTDLTFANFAAVPVLPQDILAAADTTD